MKIKTKRKCEHVFKNESDYFCGDPKKAEKKCEYFSSIGMYTPLVKRRDKLKLAEIYGLMSAMNQEDIMAHILYYSNKVVICDKYNK